MSIDIGETVDESVFETVGRLVDGSVDGMDLPPGGASCRDI